MGSETGNCCTFKKKECLEKLQTGSIKNRTSLRSRHEVANTVRNEKEADKNSWSEREDEGEKSSPKGKGGINVI